MDRAQIDRRLFRDACDERVSRFFTQFPDPDFQTAAGRALQLLMERRHKFPGSPGGWLGGILYCMHQQMFFGGPVFNADMERLMGVSMGTIRKRSKQVWPLIRYEICSRIRENKRWPRIVGATYEGDTLVPLTGWTNHDGTPVLDICTLQEAAELSRCFLMQDSSIDCRLGALADLRG